MPLTNFAKKVAQMSLYAMLILPSCAELSPGRSCPFVYNNKVRDEIVVPTLKEHGQKFYWLYDLDKPTITYEQGRISLLFMQSIKSVDGNAFVIVLNSCTLRIFKAYETPPTYIFEPPSGNL